MRHAKKAAHGSPSIPGKRRLLVDDDTDLGVFDRNDCGAAGAVAVPDDDAMLARVDREPGDDGELAATAFATRDLTGADTLAGLVHQANPGSGDTPRARNGRRDRQLLALRRRVAQEDAGLLALIVEDKIERATVVVIEEGNCLAVEDALAQAPFGRHVLE